MFHVLESFQNVVNELITLNNLSINILEIIYYAVSDPSTTIISRYFAALS